MTAPDPWEWWRNALAGNHAPIHDGEPHTGYYRVRRKGRDGLVPVAYWLDTQTGEQRCHMDGSDFDLQRALEIWPYASKNPVTAEAYGERQRTGKWPDESAAVIGHNAAPVGDGILVIADRIEDLAREAERMIAAGAAATDDACDQASDLANTFGELEGKADKLRTDEKAPHLEAGRLVDAKWRPLLDRAADLKKRLKAIVVTPFLKNKSAEVYKANVAAISAGAAPESLPQQRTTAGSSKRATALRTHYFAKIVDKAKLIESLQEHPDLVACIQSIADAAAKKKIALPGCEVQTEQRAA